MYNGYRTVAENEAKFQKAFDENDLATMWECTYRTCENICKSIYSKRCVVVDYLDDVVSDATIYCMTFFTGKSKKYKGIRVRPDRLSSYCYLRCLKYINSNRYAEHSGTIDIDLLANTLTTDKTFIEPEIEEEGI